MDFFRIWAGRIFQDKNGVTRPIDKHLVGTAAGAGLSLVPANATKEITVLSATLVSEGVQTYCQFKAGATVLKKLQVPANTVASPNVILPYNESGWMRTPINTALLVDIGAVDCIVDIEYILVTP